MTCIDFHSFLLFLSDFHEISAVLIDLHIFSQMWFSYGLCTASGMGMCGCWMGAKSGDIEKVLIFKVSLRSQASTMARLKTSASRASETACGSVVGRFSSH